MTRWESFRFWFTIKRYEIQEHAWAILVTVGVIAVAVAMIVEPAWSLRFERVLAWPVIVLAAIVLFRQPALRLLEGRTLRSLNLGPGGIAAELEAEQATAEPELVGGVTEPEVMLALFNLVQIYQVQIDFLRYIGQTEQGILTPEATMKWFRSTLGPRATTDAEVDPLVEWLVLRNLTTVLEDGRYALSELGRSFIAHIEGFWYAPKTL